MRSLRIGRKGPLIALLVLMGSYIDAVAATGVTACADSVQNSSESKLMLVDYSRKTRTETSAEILQDSVAIDTANLALTPDVDTTVRRDDHIEAELKLPVNESLGPVPDAAALLLERRNARIQEASSDEEADMNTELPGMDRDEMLQFRQQMYRTDI